MQTMHRFLRWNRARNGQIRFQKSDGIEVIGCLAKDISSTSATLLIRGDTEIIPSEFELSLDGIGSRTCWVKR